MTVFTDHTMSLSLELTAGAQATLQAPNNATTSCTLLLRVLSGTSSGSHYFKVRDLVLYTDASPCDGHESWAHGSKALLERRNNLHCAVRGSTKSNA